MTRTTRTMIDLSVDLLLVALLCFVAGSALMAVHRGAPDALVYVAATLLVVALGRAVLGARDVYRALRRLEAARDRIAQDRDALLAAAEPTNVVHIHGRAARPVQQ